MRKFIVTTSIYHPTEATRKFASKKDWRLIVVGDLKTPHESYKDIDCIYLSPEYQRDTYPELSEAIGWNCIMRRNIGFVDAYRRGADILATVDDDNIPYESWGKNLLVGDVADVDEYYAIDSLAFNPLSCTNYPELWHRGFPLTELGKPIEYFGKERILVEIQADLWDGDPDVDAICRLDRRPKNLKLTVNAPFFSKQMTPFNSQNTFLTRRIIPYYMVLPFVGRMDDIWGGYIAQYLARTTPVFTAPTVFQDRNSQSVFKNLRDEIMGYEKTPEFIYSIGEYRKLLPAETLNAFDIYRSQFYVQ